MIYDQYGHRVESRPPRESALIEHPFDAAKRLNSRALFFFPTLDQSELINQPTRDEINRKVTWLYNNMDPVRLVIDGLSLGEVANGIWPKATTSSPDFNKAVTTAFHEQNKDPRFFSASAAESFYSAQWMLRRTIYLYGELFGQFLRPGYPINLPCMHFINSWQCSVSAGKQDPKEGWREGVKRIPIFNRPINYRFSTGSGQDDFVDAPADDILHFHDKFWNGQVRGLSCLTPVVRKLFTLDDIERAQASGLRLRQRMAYTITKDTGNNEAALVPGASKVERIVNADGSSVTIQKVIQHDSEAVDVATLPAGYKLGVLESNRSESPIEFIKQAHTAIANVTLYPAPYVFSMADYAQGTAVRFSQERVQLIKDTVRQQQLVPQFVDRYYTFWLWQRIKAGAFDKAGIPDDWWAHKNIFPADDTVDLAREGKLYDERVRTGLMSPSTYHGMAGEDDEDVEIEVVTARVRRLRLLKKMRDENPDLAEGITYDSIFAPGSKAATSVDDPKGGNEENDDSKNKESKE